MYERRSGHKQNAHERLRHSCIVHDQIGVHTSMNTKQKEFNLLINTQHLKEIGEGRKNRRIPINRP